EAVAPARDLHLHRPLHSSRRIYIGYPSIAVKLPVDAAMQRYLTSRNSSMPYFEPSELRNGADAAFLAAAEGGDPGRDDALVDADVAVFERLGDAPDAADVAAVATPSLTLPRERGRAGWGVSLAILTASASLLKR